MSALPLDKNQLTHFVEDDLQQMRRQDRRPRPILKEARRRDLLAEVVGAHRSILKRFGGDFPQCGIRISSQGSEAGLPDFFYDIPKLEKYAK
jgi:hypothetical protein